MKGEVQLRSHRQPYKKDQSWIRMRLLEVTPSKFSYHVSDARVGGNNPQGPIGLLCSSLNSFNFMYVILSVGVPYWSNILQMGSDNGFVCISLSEVFCVLRFFLRKPNDLFAAFVILLIWVFQDGSFAMSTPRYLGLATSSRVSPCRV